MTCRPSGRSVVGTANLRSIGFTGAQVEGVLGMSRGQRGFTPENPRELITTTPTPLDAWAHAVLRPALAA
jgi:hypothetical protein